MHVVVVCARPTAFFHPETTMHDPTVVGLERGPRDIHFLHDGADLYACERGDGPPVVFLHGGLADHRAALFHAQHLAATCRLVTPDLRGSGRSVDASAPSWDRFADDVAALCDHLGLAAPIIGGTSMGSAVALRFALRHPTRVRALVILSPLYPGETGGLAPAASAAMEAMAAAGERALAHGMDALRPLYERLPAPMRDLAIAMMLGFDPASVAATTRFLATGAQPFGSADALAAIGVPVFLVPGTDPQHPREVAELYARHLRRTTMVEATQPDLLERLARFCAELSATSARGFTLSLRTPSRGTSTADR